jgi:hypothetical protein
MRTLKEIYNGLTETQFQAKLADFKFFTEQVIGWQVKPFHLEWFNMAEKNRRIAIQAPTGFGKTSILGTAYCLWRAIRETGKEFCIVSKSLPQSTKVLSSIKETIEDNEYLQQLIPKGRPVGMWCSATMMDLATSCKIFCRPYSENIKGIHVDYVLGDEVASYDDPSIWYRFVVTRTNAKNGICVAISTPDNISDLMQELLCNPEYVGKSYPAESPVGTSIWPEHFPMSKLNKIKNEIGIAAYEREYMCNCKAEVENAVFPPHLVVECFELNQGFKMSPQDGYTVIGADFAIASGPRADFDAYCVINKFGPKSAILYGEVHKGFTIAAKVARLKELYHTYQKKLTEEEEKNPDLVKNASTIKFVIDPSSVGQAVLEVLRSEGYRVEAGKFDYINRNMMIINLRQMIENKDLIIPRHAEDESCQKFTDTLIRELISLMETKSKNGQISYQTKGPHDDTVMALAMACYGVSQQKEMLMDW